MLHVFVILFGLPMIDGYKIQGHGQFPLSRDRTALFEIDITDKRTQHNESHYLNNITQQSFFDYITGLWKEFQEKFHIEHQYTDHNQQVASYIFHEGNRSKMITHENIHSELNKQNYKQYLAHDFIQILLKFEYRPIERTWDARPNLKAFSIDDLAGHSSDKLNFLSHLKNTADLYKSTIDKCEAQQFKKHKTTMPDHLIVTDLVNMAHSCKVSIIRNGATPFDIYSTGYVDLDAFTNDDIEGSPDNIMRFFKRLNHFSVKEFREAFNKVSLNIYGLPVPHHINTEWAIATANDYNVVIKTYKGKPFDMNWRSSPSSHIGYPAGSSGGMEYVHSVCLKLKNFDYFKEKMEFKP